MPPRGFILLMSGEPCLCLNPHMLAISEVSLQELLQNALIHLDLLNHAAIRLLVFSDRVEIVNPGWLHGGLEVGDLELGISRRRNPLMAQLASRTMPCCAARAGIIRVLREGTGVRQHDIGMPVQSDDPKEGFACCAWRWAHLKREALAGLRMLSPCIYAKSTALPCFLNSGIEARAQALACRKSHHAYELVAELCGGKAGRALHLGGEVGGHVL